MKGLFITLEGGEGAGKSTQAKKLADYFSKQGREVLLTCEPGDTKVGAQIRKIILDPENTCLTPSTEAFLYAADRMQHVECVIAPALAEGKVVICDRYVDSNIAYQGYGRGLDMDMLLALNNLATGGLMPNLSFFIHVPPKVGLARALARSAADRLEQEKIEFHEKLCNGFLAIAEQEKERVTVVDGNGSEEEVFSQIVAVAEKFACRR